MFGARQSTRDVAVEARSLTQAHIEECKREREITRRNFEELKKDFDDKHKENKTYREADRADFQTFQRKLLIFAIIVLASLALKGTHLDILSTFLSTL